LIKSKVNLEHLDEEGRWMRIFSCDFAMLIYGVLSFVGFLFIGYRLGGKESALLFGSLWFVFWIALGYLGFKKQLFESALLFNAIVFLFIFGGQILSYVPSLKDSSTVERFEARTRMCVNTWGDLDIEHLGKHAEPVSNTQVANGLWALATGGIRGQGWGGGKPSLVPAFHTDMILSSIGEQMGWIGLLMVVIALAVLLRKMAVIGYRVGHPFAFYLCLGFAIVIGVQFFIIALGSSGMIPLTGVTVPFLSFGRVSMILNLAAFGIVLSLCNNIREDETAVSANVRQKTVGQYSYPIAMVTMVFLFFAITTLLVWQYYQLWKRDSTLIHPAYVINNQGAPVVEYNPRINLLVRNMYAGRIYDRNGILLATSEKSEISPGTYTNIGIDQKKIDNMLKRNQRRYYPMGEHMFFMVGDQNEGIMFAYNERHPVGYMAEAQHLSYLRGFDNIMYNKSGKPIKVALKTDRLRESIFLMPKDTVSDSIQLRNYSELLVFLKDGIDGKKVAQHNKKVKEEKYDLHLTVDAALQADLQNSIAEYVNNDNRLKGFNLMRISVVVLDAKNGDLLASANYPLPDYKRLRDESEANTRYYSDNEKGYDWPVYTDRDLGTTYQTAPGSTAKVMSAMAGFMKMGTDASTVTYRITNANAIEKNGKGYAIEPTIDKHDPVKMSHAIVESSNCYFVSLVNDKDLYGELKTVYSSIGINIGGITPYYYSSKEDAEREQKYYAKIDKNRHVALRKYDLFKQGKLKDPKDKKIKPMNQTNMSVPEWKWAWGQGYSDDQSKESFELLASPLNMARVAATVVNKGEMPITQYLMPINDYEKSHRNKGTLRLMNQNEAIILKDYMLAEADNQKTRNSIILPQNVGGKTGTPERSRVLKSWQVFSRKQNKYITKTILENKGITNDGWYMFFVDGGNSDQSIAVAVRMERLRNVRTGDHTGSGAAVRLTGNLLLDCLNRHGYIRYN
jgi:cell division protein FtsW (lipid II flippase)